MAAQVETWLRGITELRRWNGMQTKIN